MYVNYAKNLKTRETVCIVNNFALIEILSKNVVSVMISEYIDIFYLLILI